MKRAEQNKATRERLFATALRLFAEQGFENTSVDEITREASVSKGTFFNYFPTKEDVLRR